MKKIIVLTSILAMTLLLATTAEAQNNKAGVYAFKFEDSKGKTVQLADYKGKTLLLVNVASKCGYTKQYTTLEALNQKYKNKGLVILAFPCNQFGGQEPGSNEEIQEFCQSKYNVTFPVLAKIKVNGEDAHPLYQYLKEQTGGGAIKWNFNKFLLDKNGNIVKRYASGDSLEGLEVDILAAL